MSRLSDDYFWSNPEYVYNLVNENSMTNFTYSEEALSLIKVLNSTRSYHKFYIGETVNVEVINNYWKLKTKGNDLPGRKLLSMFKGKEGAIFHGIDVYVDRKKINYDVIRLSNNYMPGKRKNMAVGKTKRLTNYMADELVLFKKLAIEKHLAARSRYKSYAVTLGKNFIKNNNKENREIMLEKN